MNNKDWENGTYYDWFERWSTLGWVPGKKQTNKRTGQITYKPGKMQASIKLGYSRALHGISDKEYLIDLLHKDRLCGQAEKDAIALKEGRIKWNED